MEQEMEILQGAVSAVVYQNYENGYTVLRLNVGGGQMVTVVGTIPLPAVGERLMVTGRWSTHSSYGRQFEAEFLERLMPQTAMEILSYLSSRVIKGIGELLEKSLGPGVGMGLENKPQLIVMHVLCGGQSSLDLRGMVGVVIYDLYPMLSGSGEIKTSAGACIIMQCLSYDLCVRTQIRCGNKGSHGI